MMKSVPNLISYLQEFSQIFPHLVSIFLVRKAIFENFWKWKKGWRVGPTSQPLCHRTPRPDWLAGAVPCAGYKARSDSLAVRNRRSLSGRARLALFPLVCESSPLRLACLRRRHAHFPFPSPQAVSIEVIAGERVEASVLFLAGEPPPLLLRCWASPPHTAHLPFFLTQDIEPEHYSCRCELTQSATVNQLACRWGLCRVRPPAPLNPLPSTTPRPAVERHLAVAPRHRRSAACAHSRRRARTQPASAGAHGPLRKAGPRGRGPHARIV
jgi:hypothetical protein